MSLKLFLNNPDVRARFKAEFVKPSLGTKGILLAPPLTQNYSLVGTAFDYLLRFHIKRLNPRAKASKWIAESSARMVTDLDGRSILEIIKQIKIIYKFYLQDGKIDDDLLLTVLCLAKLDVLQRAGLSYLDDIDIANYDALDKKDLKQLISAVSPTLFKAKKVCSLNPTFGEGSILVRGADADLVIDDALIEIKTTQKFEVPRDAFNQLIGYYILSRIGGISGTPKNHSITKLGIYFSRHGYLWLFNVDSVIKEKALPQFITWFRNRAGNP